jgi:DNA-binding LacI/PurR family transcriptional regulator
VPLLEDVYFSTIVSGIAETVYAQGMHLLVAPTLHEHAREVSLLERLRNESDGAVIVLPEQSSDELARTISACYPLVVVDPLLPLDQRVPTIAVAHTMGAEHAMRHLLALGHRRIAAITGPPGWQSTEERRLGYESSLAASGVPVDPGLVVAADFEFTPGLEAARTLLDRVEPPSAIFGFNDDIAFGAIRAVHERGLRVPEDVSVIGFGDIRSASLVTPALTTIRSPLAELGRTGVRLLLRPRGGAHETFRVELPTRLVLRGSTAPAPA